MIPVAPPAEPATFDAECRVPGNAWLATHPDGRRPPDHWRHFLGDLCAGFGNRCGYLAMLDMTGTVDHFQSTSRHRDLTYEWSNYRYATGWLNSSKQTLDGEVLDPFQVREAWFEIDLPTLHLRLTAAVPARVRPRATETIRRLHLDYGDRVMRSREFYHGAYRNGEFTLDFLERVAPMIATAVRRESLRTHLTTNPPVGRSDAATICQVSLNRAAALLRIWREAGHLVPAGGRRATTVYRLA